MKFQTQIEIKPFVEKIDYRDKILMLGSCFTNNIGERMAAAKFDVCINPFGATYNPASVASSINLLVENKKINESNLAQHNGLWYNFAYHTSFSDSDKMLAAWKMNAALLQGANYIRNANFVIVTLGTAYAYKNKSTGEIVNNCHKISASQFDKVLLEIGEIVNVLSSAVEKLKAINSNVKFIFTVSPIRHLSDGAHENQSSKARLLIAIDELCKAQKNCAYFPSYEIMMDELRDYRFYADDMLHPSPLAIDYIWQRFAEVAITTESLTIMDELKNILAAKSHRPLSTKSDEYLKFMQTFAERTRQMQKKYPFLNLSEEQNFFDNVK